VAIRNRNRGSRYVQMLVKVLMEDAHNTDILNMLTKVHFFRIGYCFSISDYFRYSDYVDFDLYWIASSDSMYVTNQWRLICRARLTRHGRRRITIK